MTMWIPLSLVLLMLGGLSEGRTGILEERCHCRQVHHRQDIICKADFAYRVRIQNAGFTTAPGEPYEWMLFYPYWKYEAEIVETFKAPPHMTLRDDDIAEFYTPIESLCGLPTLYDHGIEDYFFSGYIAEGENGHRYMAITICTWVQPWSDLTEEQIKGLKGSYSDCGCTIFPASSGLLLNNAPQDKFRMEECLFNPISAEVHNVPDCEQLYGFCKWNEEQNTCHWEDIGAYRVCFKSRQQKLSQNGKAAVMTKEGCAIYSGKKRKQCILKFIRSRNRSS